MTLQRSDATLTIVNEGRAADGARSVLNLAGCVPDEPLVTSLFYAPEAGVTTRIQSSESDSVSLVRAPLVIVTRPEEGGDEQETLEARDATTEFGRPPCLENTEAADPPEVSLEQGRTTVTGARFFLDREDDVASMDGPVTLNRAGEDDAPPLEADADGMDFDLDTDRTTLTGNVEVRSEDRVSRSDTLELDEPAGVAVLRGDPATSTQDGDEVQGSTLIYDLETNDVVVEGGVSGSFQLEEEEE